MIGQNKKLCRIGERLVLREPCRVGMTVGADDREIANSGIEAARDAARLRISGKQPVLVKDCHVTHSAVLSDSGLTTTRYLFLIEISNLMIEYCTVMVRQC
jgi:hypothetical protein